MKLFLSRLAALYIAAALLLPVTVLAGERSTRGADAAAEEAPKEKRSATLTVRLDRFRNDKGRVLVAVYASAEDFLDGEKAYRWTTAKVIDGKAEVRFPSLLEGTYAVVAIHDADTNGNLNRNFLGIPTEGIGASNDAIRRTAPPRFKDASFAFTTEATSISFRIRYFL